MTTQTLRRLDDRERYWGLTWPAWVAAAAGAGVLYLAVRFSPLATKPTITITLFILAFGAMVLYGVSGQAMSPGRQLLAIASYRRSRKLLELSDRVQRRGLVLDRRPSTTPPTVPTDQVDVDVDDDHLDKLAQLSDDGSPDDDSQHEYDDPDWQAEAETEAAIDGHDQAADELLADAGEALQADRGDHPDSEEQDR